MDARDARGPAEASQQLFEPVRPEADAGVEARGVGGTLGRDLLNADRGAVADLFDDAHAAQVDAARSAMAAALRRASSMAASRAVSSVRIHVLERRDWRYHGGIHIELNAVKIIACLHRVVGRSSPQPNGRDTLKSVKQVPPHRGGQGSGLTCFVA